MWFSIILVRPSPAALNELIVLHPLGILFSFFSFSVRKIPFAGIELTSQRVRGYMVPLSYRGDRSCQITVTLQQ